MTTSDARKRLAESVTRLDARDFQGRINAMHDRLIAALDAVHPPTEPTPQEHDMTSPTQRRHEELVALLAEIRDRLPERTEVKAAPFDPDLVARNLDAIKHEIETPMREHGECCEPAPADVDPDEALARVIFGDAYGSHEGLRLAQLDVARAARERIQAEEAAVYVFDLDTATERATKAEAEVERLTRERDEARRDVRTAERQTTEQQARYEALRADVGARGPFGFPLLERAAILDPRRRASREGRAAMTADHIDRARDIIERHLPAMPDQQAAFVTRDAARALDAAGLLVTPARDAEETCGHTVVDADGIEEPCGLPVALGGWRYYEGYEHEDTLRRVCADHEQWALSNGIRARDAEVAEQVRAEFEDMEHRLSVLLCNLTGGLLSKTGYDVATMEQHIEDYFEREVVEPARVEARAETLAEVSDHIAEVRAVERRAAILAGAVTFDSGGVNRSYWRRQAKASLNADPEP